MKLSTLLRADSPTLSFEVFPPKKDSDASLVRSAVTEIAVTHPDFMSVTYGAGGGTSAYTAELAGHVQACGVNVLAHLTCVSSCKDEIHSRLTDFRARGIENVLALRGDLPEGESLDAAHYRYAYELVEELRAFGGFCIGAACYPEGHVECAGAEEDLRNLKAKVDCGCDFLVTQMFFDNSALYSFLYRAARLGIDLPVVAGVMPVTNAKQISRICQLSGTTLPHRFRRIVDKFGHNPAAMKQAGIAYATEQIVDLLANGVRGVHVYTMNKPDIAAAISQNLSAIVARL